MTRVEIVRADQLHAREMCENMRERERSTLKKLGVTPEDYLAETMRLSLYNWAGLADGEVVCLWGVQAAPLADEGYVWMVCSEALLAYPRTFLRHSHAALETVRPLFRRLYGGVLCDFDKSADWLQWMGFKVGPPNAQGICPFELRN